MDKLKLEQSDVDRRTSMATISEAGSEFERKKKIKYGGPLAGKKVCSNCLIIQAYLL